MNEPVSVDLNTVVGEYRRRVDDLTYENIVIKAALADARTELAELRDSTVPGDSGPLPAA